MCRANNGSYGKRRINLIREGGKDAVRQGTKIHTENVTCHICGGACDLYNATFFDGAYVCENCMSEYTFICDKCGRKFWIHEGYHSKQHDVCNSCFLCADIYCKNRDRRTTKSRAQNKKELTPMEKLKMVELVLMALTTLISAAKAIVKVVVHFRKAKPTAA